MHAMLQCHQAQWIWLVSLFSPFTLMGQIGILTSKVFIISNWGVKCYLQALLLTDEDLQGLNVIFVQYQLCTAFTARALRYSYPCPMMPHWIFAASRSTVCSIVGCCMLQTSHTFSLCSLELKSLEYGQLTEMAFVNLRWETIKFGRFRVKRETLGKGGKWVPITVLGLDYSVNGVNRQWSLVSSQALFCSRGGQ